MGLVFGPLVRMVLRSLRNLVLRDGVPFWYLEPADLCDCDEFDVCDSCCDCEFCTNGWSCDTTWGSPE